MRAVPELGDTPSTRLMVTSLLIQRYTTPLSKTRVT